MNSIQIKFQLGKGIFGKSIQCFSTANEEVKQDQEAEMSKLFEQIGRQKIEIEWMKKITLKPLLKEET